MEKKIGIAIKCLYAVIGVQFLSIAQLAYLQIKIDNETSTLGIPTPDIASPLFGPAMILPFAVIILSLFCVRDLRKGESWAWVAAISIFVITLPSLALPASVFGLLNLIDQKVRTPFIAKLDIQL